MGGIGTKRGCLDGTEVGGRRPSAAVWSARHAGTAPRR